MYREFDDQSMRADRVEVTALHTVFCLTSD